MYRTDIVSPSRHPIEQIQSFLASYESNNPHFISLEKLRSWKTEDLLNLFSTKIGSFTTCVQACAETRFALARPTYQEVEAPPTTITYSSYVDDAEQILKTLNNVNTVLCERGILDQPDVCNRSSVIQSLNAQLQEMYDKMPEGPSMLLEKDKANLANMSIIPPQQILDSKWGRFYTPKVSQSLLTNWFEPYRREGKYNGVGIAIKADALYNCNLERIVTRVMLTKSDVQVHAEKRLMLTQSDPQARAEKIDYHTKIQNPQAKLSDSGQKKPSYKKIMTKAAKATKAVMSHATLDSPPQPEHSSKTMKQMTIKNNQESILEEIKAALHEEIKSWNYADFKVGSTKEMREDFHVDTQYLGHADFVLLYYKRV